MAGRVLVVDDDPGFADLATRLLTDWGYDVIGDAATVAEGLAQAERLRPDMVLVDVALPDGNGFDLAGRLRALSPPAAVVLVSADPGHGAQDAARRAGCRGFLLKDDLTAAALDALLDGP